LTNEIQGFVAIVATTTPALVRSGFITGSVCRDFILTSLGRLYTCGSFELGENLKPTM